jgi:hypothetical protein
MKFLPLPKTAESTKNNLRSTEIFLANPRNAKKRPSVNLVSVSTANADLSEITLSESMGLVTLVPISQIAIRTIVAMASVLNV